MTDDVIFIEVEKDILSVHTIKNTYLTYLTLKEVEEQLLGTGEFLKINRSVLIAAKHLFLIEKNKIEMSNKRIIVIGDVYKKQFFNDLKKNMFRSSHVQGLQKY